MEALAKTMQGEKSQFMNMFRSHSVRFNFAMNLILKCSSALLSVVSYSFAFQALGTEGAGKVAFSNSVASLFTMVAALGIPTYGIRECARVRDQRERLSGTVWALLKLQIRMTGVTAFALFVTVLCVPRFQQETCLFMVQGCVLLVSGLNLEWMYEGLEQYAYITFRSVLTKVLGVLLILLLIRNPSDYRTYAALLALDVVLHTLINLFFAGRFITWRSAKEASRKKHGKLVLTFFAQTAAITVYTSLDSAMLGFLQNDDCVGIYDAAVKVKLVLSYFVTSLSAVLLPRLSYYVSTRREEKFRRELSGSLEFLLIAGMCIAVFTLLAAPEIIEFLFRGAYVSSAGVLRVLALAIPLIGMSSLVGQQILVPTDKEEVAMYAYLAGAVTDVILDALLIPRFEAVGAAVGTLIAEVVVLIVQIAAAHETVVPSIKHSKIGSAVATAAISGAGLWAVRRAVHVSVFKQLVLDGVVYFGLVACVLVVAKRSLIMQWIRK